MNVERIVLKIAAATAALLLAASMATAAQPAAAPTPTAHHGVGIAPRPEGEPIFFRWLDRNDPFDATILEYWKRYESGKLSPEETVDLGTMLFERGWPKDAVRVYEAAGKANPDLYEAWFRAGLVEHSLHNLGAAKKYYEKCLKALVNNGWCNFYMGLAEEQSSNGSKALKYYRKAFKVAPQLGDPRSNPAVLQSRIARAAAVMREYQDRFVDDMPMSYLDPREVEKTEIRFGMVPPTPTPSARSAPPAPPGAAASPTATPTARPTPSRHISRTPGARRWPTALPRPQSSGNAMHSRKHITLPKLPRDLRNRKFPTRTPSGTANELPWGGGPLPHTAPRRERPPRHTPAPRTTPTPRPPR